MSNFENYLKHLGHEPCTKKTLMAPFEAEVDVFREELASRVADKDKLVMELEKRRQEYAAFVKLKKTMEIKRKEFEQEAQRQKELAVQRQKELEQEAQRQKELEAQRQKELEEERKRKELADQREAQRQKELAEERRRKELEEAERRKKLSEWEEYELREQKEKEIKKKQIKRIVFCSCMVLSVFFLFVDLGIISMILWGIDFIIFWNSFVDKHWNK